MYLIKKIKSLLLLLKYNCYIVTLFKHHRMAILLGAPFHPNMGDQAQTFCTEEWLKRNYPDTTVISLDTKMLTLHNYHILNVIKRNIKENDLLFLHSGYHTTDLYMLEENLQRQVIKMFPDRRIVILPQTINYESDKEKENSRFIYNRHRSLVLMCRDEVSFNNAKDLFPNCSRLLLFPDIVTTMIGMYHYNYRRNGIMLCLRNDKESFYGDSQITDLKRNLESIDFVDVTDTTIEEPVSKIIKNRKGTLENIWDSYAKYRVIITDRYHGTIFSLIASTPVIIISSKDHKLSSGVKWFPESFSDYVKYVPDISNIPDVVKRIYETSYSYCLPNYFNENYYDKLKSILE